MNKKLLAMTLIEMMITIGIIGILAGATVANLSKLKSPKDRIDDATDIIVSMLNQANAQSVATSNPATVCKLVAGTSGSQCDSTLGSASAVVLDNVNGVVFARIIINITGPSRVITYSNGLVADKFIIQVTFADKTTCSNSIIVWPNSIIDVNKALDSNC